MNKLRPVFPAPRPPRPPLAFILKSLSIFVSLKTIEILNQNYSFKICALVAEIKR